MKEAKISVVLPIYNEAGCIEKLLVKIEEVIGIPLEFVCIDDGSTDNTLGILKKYKLKKSHNSKKIVVLSRNFGHQQALMAGLSNVSKESKLILVMDADFQDDPSQIPLLIEKIQEGYDCVYAFRKSRSENFLMRFITRTFYRIVSSITSFNIPRDAGTFSVFNRNVLEKIIMFSETDIYFPGLRAYVGYRQTGVPIKRAKRAHGKSRVGLRGLIDLSFIALFNFSGVPMRIIFLSGVLITFLCVMLSLTVFILKILGITKIPGITTTLIVIMTLAGIQITFIGIVGEYIGKLLSETKKRPRWLMKELIDER